MLTALLLSLLAQPCEVRGRWRPQHGALLRLVDGTPWAEVPSRDVDPRGALARVTFWEGGGAGVEVKAAGVELSLTTFGIDVSSPPAAELRGFHDVEGDAALGGVARRRWVWVVPAPRSSALRECNGAPHMSPPPVGPP